jgi:hypothetical protein
MSTKEKLAKLKDSEYQSLFGVKKPVFYLMLDVLERKDAERELKTGRPRKLNVLDKLVILLEYYHDYLSMQKMAYIWGVAKSQIREAVSWVENILIKDGHFALPSKRKLLEADNEIEYIIVDATECPTERPKKTK